MTSQILLLDKQQGPSSARALGPVKRELGIRKIGHTGTLDPFASGLLVLLAGGATRLARWFSRLDKSYVARVAFGSETSTLDPEGEVVDTAQLPSRSDIERVLDTFRGAIEQVPPAFSAIRINGKHAYERARAGEVFEPDARVVMIHALEVTDWEADGDRIAAATISVHCGSGTYIRSLARDLGRRAGSCASLTALRRTSVGPFGVLEAGGDWASLSVRDAWQRLQCGGLVVVDRESARAIAQGKQPVPLDRSQLVGLEAGASVLAETTDARPCAIVAVGEGGQLTYEAVFPTDEPGANAAGTARAALAASAADAGAAVPPGDGQ